MSGDLYYEDFTLGQVFRSGSIPVTAEQIKTFAADFDPQPFHLDEAAAEHSFFDGLAASGWHTAALTMRLRVETIRIAGGMIGAGIDEMRWTKAVRPGDTLRMESEILALRVLHSRPGYGILKSSTTTYNQHDEPVLRMTANILVPRRTAAESESPAS